MSNSLEPDQAPLSVGPDLGPNCLQKLSADDTSRQKLKMNSASFKASVQILYIIICISCTVLYIYRNKKKDEVKTRIIRKNINEGSDQSLSL